MSIGPVQAVGPAQQADAKPRPAQPPETAADGTKPAPSNSGTAPKAELHIPPNAVASTELPEDEVQVQRDSQTNGEIVIRYVDRFGSVVLQVPSSEMLGVSQAIDENLEREAKLRSAGTETPPANEGGKNHGR